ncbi:hypothetical protein BGLA2_780029 [Burkholderia gladioli]|nr:hypothetical protein BGLA2_780029 [Burkholderia gladioli]
MTPGTYERQLAGDAAKLPQTPKLSAAERE